MVGFQRFISLYDEEWGRILATAEMSSVYQIMGFRLYNDNKMERNGAQNNVIRFDS